MPRKNRLDFPGALHHVIARGIEKKNIFQKKEDKLDFLNRLRANVEAHDIKLYAWCIMSNHTHLLLQTGEYKVSSFMRKILTGYAISYNKRHKRVGHLFQNRYKSVLCEKEEYLLRLIRYIHLNPVKAKMISIEDLDTYKWTSHKDILSATGTELPIEVDEVLSHFGRYQKVALKHYLRFISEGVDLDEELSSGGLKKSLGKNLSQIQKSEIDSFDDRILGIGDFVNNTLKKVEFEEYEKHSFESIGQLIAAIETYYRLPEGELLVRSKSSREPRDVFLYLGKTLLGKSCAELGEQLGIQRSPASKGFIRGRQMCTKTKIKDNILKNK